MSNFKEIFLNSLGPRRCFICDVRLPRARTGDAPDIALCAGCREDLPRPAALVCPRCALPVPSEGTCGACLKAPPAFDRCRAGWRFAYPLDSLVHAFKYRRQRWLRRPLAALLAQTLPETVEVDAIVPMPLDPAHLAERGFNQARDLGAALARRYGLPLLTRAARRRPAGLRQAGLPFEQRRRNVRGVFSAITPAPRRVAIVDDVVTSAATVEELAGVLRRAGAERIEIWTLTRTYPSSDR